MRKRRGRREFPVRPHVPATMGAAASSLLTSGVLLEAAWRGYTVSGTAAVSFPVLFVLLMAAAACMMALRFSALRRRPAPLALWLRWAAIGIFLAALASCGWIVSWRSRCDAVSAASLGTCTFTVRGDPSISVYGTSMTAGVRAADGRMLGAVRLTAENAYDTGSALSLVARRKPLDATDWARSRFMKGEVASVQAVKVRHVTRGQDLDPIGRLRLAALATIEPERSDARALIAGIVCGRTTELNQVPASDDFAVAGLTHLVAVSGSHLAFIALLLQSCLRRLRARPSVRALSLLAVMAGYVVFTGCAASAVRSVVMVGCSLLSGLGLRRAHPLSGLALTMTALVLLDPGVTFDLGFQLSAASVLFILVFGRYLAHLIARIGAPDGVAEALSLTLAAQWATVPLTVPVFGQLSLIAPLANLLAGPVMSALLVVGLITVPLCTAVPMFSFLMAAPEALANASMFLGGMLARFPFAALPVSLASTQLAPCYVAAVGVYLLWRDWRRWQIVGAAVGACLALALHILRWTLFAPVGVTVLDVGQADAILVRDGASSILVDAGVDDAVVAALARNHVYRIDAVAITHWDRDHWGGLPAILAAVPVGRLIVPEGAADAVPAEVRAVFPGEIVEVSDGDHLNVGGFTCEMLWPRAPVIGEENADSLVLAVSYERGGGALSVLLTGDTERDELMEYALDAGDIDVLKVGHHGSKVSVDPDVLGIIDPEVAVASAGAGNRYGHPSQACIDAVEESGALFLSTIESGDVVISPGPTGPVVRTSR